MSRQPNFVLFVTDQHRADYLGCYGHPVLKTPHIDSIAARGVSFDCFYVATPVCMPNRSTLMTGRMPSVHGARGNGNPLSLRANTFVDALRATTDAGGLYTFWDYKTFGWQKNIGIRIDHLLLSPQAADLLAGVAIDKHIRGGYKMMLELPA